jgi:hypothetical protein
LGRLFALIPGAGAVVEVVPEAHNVDILKEIERKYDGRILE